MRPTDCTLTKQTMGRVLRRTSIERTMAYSAFAGLTTGVFVLISG
jgi:hypothetical protein